MFVLEPIFHYTIWGGSRLTNVYGDRARELGHLYSVRCKEDECSNIVLNGKYAGQTLFDVIGSYPLTIALVDAREDLSIQVHPGNELAKHESYYFIEAPKSGYMYCGIDDLTLEAVESGDVLSKIKRIPIKKGDYCYIEPCTVHALTAGSFVYEVEHGTDVTYRLYDYMRKDDQGKLRQLQGAQAYKVLDSNMFSKAKPLLSGDVISEKTYSVELLTCVTEFKNTEQTKACLTLLAGSAVIDGVPLKQGMSVVFDKDDEVCNIEIEKCIVARAVT